MNTGSLKDKVRLQTGAIPPQRNEPRIRISPDPTILCLGRFGDITNALPIAWELHRVHKKPIRWIVAKEFASIFNGVSYVEPIVWNGHYQNQTLAANWAGGNRLGGRIVPVSAYGGSDRLKSTSSYQLEGWRIAGWLHRFGEFPMVFDKLNPVDAGCFGDPKEEPFILVNLGSISSPIQKLNGLFDALKSELPEFKLMNMADLKLPHVYDLVSVMNCAQLTISVDSVPLHLAKAAICPVISIINDGWLGSVPPPTSIASFRYADVTVESVVKAAVSVLRRPQVKVFHAVHLHGKENRHKAAQETWKKLYSQGVFPIHISELPRNAQTLHDKRPLPFMKDIFEAAMEKAGSNDVIMLTNDDIRIEEGIIDWCQKHVSLYGAATMRRVDIGQAGVHCGRDVWAATKTWLQENWNELPDCVLGEAIFDMHWAAIVRSKRSITSTIKNMSDDMFPCETPDRFASHEPHESSWTTKQFENAPGKIHNAHLFNEWRKNHGNGMSFWS